MNAKESAIFAHLRRPPPPPRHVQDEDSDEDVPLQQTRARSTMISQRSGSRSRSIDNRKSMVASVVNLDEERDEDEEVLSSWGLDGFVEKDRTSKAFKSPTELSAGLAPAPDKLTIPRTPSSPLDQLVHDTSAPIPRPRNKRPVSMGDMNDIVIGESPERSRLPPTSIEYRKSMNAALDFAVSSPTDDEHAEAEAEANANTVDFPSSTSPQRTPAIEAPNPFEVPLPNPDRLSKFDPKAQRRQSAASFGVLSEGEAGPSSRGGSVRDGDHEAMNAPRTRVGSLGTMATQQMLDAEGSPLPSPGEPEHKRLSRLDLLRPKVLVMPTPLQDKLPQRKKVARDGFFQSEDGGIPLPPGSKTEARPGIRPLGPSTSYNPRISMSLSQLTFRQSLMVGGARDPSYADIDRGLRVAMNDGEQVEQEWSEEEEPDRELRPPGKLYGKSLIDDLEARKATLKGKQR